MTGHTEERRAILRIHAVWQRHTAHGLPSRSALDPNEFGNDWSSCLIVPIVIDNENQQRFSDDGLDPNIAEHRLASTLLPLAQHHIARVLGTGQAVGYGGTALHNGTDILYRMVLLPLSEDGTHIDALLVGVTFRDVPPASELRVSDIAWCKSPLDLPQSDPVRASSSPLHKNGSPPHSP